MYKTRFIQFKEVIQIEGWDVKVYVITKDGSFKEESLYGNAKSHLPNWFRSSNGFNNAHEHKAFLILHVGTEGVFTLVNWWVGENMLTTHIYLTAPDSPSQFKLISGKGLAPCVWELEVINHERIAWTNHVLKAKEPNYSAYLADVTNLEL